MSKPTTNHATAYYRAEDGHTYYLKGNDLYACPTLASGVAEIESEMSVEDFDEPLTVAEETSIREALRNAATSVPLKLSESSDKKSPTEKAPSHAAYHVRDRKGRDAIWTRIGSAWQHADGKGFNIQIETVPLDGRISLRTPSEKTS